MKGILFSILIIFIMSVSFSFGQDKAIGLRLGATNYGNGAEISYQHGFSEKNRLELDLGMRANNHYSVLGISGIYHWKWNIDGGLNWYIGPGAQLAFFSHRDNFHGHGNGHGHDHDDDFEESGMLLFIGGQIGIEYDFNEHGVPIQLSLDGRPMWGLLSTYYSGPGYGGALGIRYTF
ncbi:MAG: hypothetical protein NXI10_05260 [bacterium]|nr:hypothetical protein [bacterium]